MVVGVKIISTDKERACKSCMDIKPHAGVSHENMDDTGNSGDESSESSSGVFWRDILIFILIFISINSDGAFWLLVQNLAACANSASGNISSGAF